MPQSIATPPTSRRIGVGAAACLGIALFLYGVNRHSGISPLVTSLMILAGGVVFGWLSGATPLYRLLDALRTPSVRGRRVTMAIVFLLTYGYVIFANVWLGRSLQPFWHDDQMHAVQARLLSEGHFYLPEHPLADFFETFHVFVKPVYSGIHFVTTSLLNAPGLRLGLPYWAVPVACVSLAAALAYRIVCELLDGVSGLTVVLLIWSIDYFRFIGPKITSHGAMMMLGMLIVWAWLKYRRRPTMKWAVVYGLLAGLALFTRPLDAMAYLVPTGLAMLLARDGPEWKPRLAQAAVAALCILPTALLQFHFDKAVTGRYLYSPYQYYNDLNYPDINYQWRNVNRAATQASHSPSTLRQKQLYYDQWLMNFVSMAEAVPLGDRIVNGRLMFTLRYSTPDAVLYLLIPIGLLGLVTLPRWVMFAVVFVYVGSYVPHLMYLPHYPTIIAPSILLLAMMGLRQIGLAWPRWSRAIEQGGLTALALAAFSTMPPFIDVYRDDAGIEMPDAAFANDVLPGLVQKPAIVLFRFVEGLNFHDEPVYNFERAWPDDESIVRAQDLGPRRDVELFRYYAERQPDRTVYLFDRASRGFYKLGNVKQLADQAAAQAATRPSKE